MPDSPDAVSSPEGGPAGEGDALTRALSAAAETLDLSETEGFAPGVMEPKREAKTEAQPVDGKDATSTEAKPDAKPAPSQDAKPETVAPTDLAPPANWDAKRKDAFLKLPTPEAKQAMLDMAKGFEAEHTKKSMEAANDVQFAKSVYALVTPAHRQQMAAAGHKTVSDAIASLVDLSDQANRNPPGYARFVVGRLMGRSPNADDLRQLFPEAFTGSEAQPNGQPQIHPQTQVYDDSPIISEINGVKQWIHAQQEATADEATERFRKAVDEAGAPKYPHLPKVETRMIALLGSPELLRIRDMGTRLEQAYETAIAQDPTIRAEIIETEAEKRAAAKVAERMKAADLEKAKRARSPIKPNPVPGAVKAKPKGLDAALQQAADLVLG